MKLVETRRLVDYGYWARDRILTVVEGLDAETYTRDMGSSFGSIRDTLVHVYGAEWVWYSRWTGVSPTVLPAPGDYPDVATLAAAWTDLEHQVRSLIDRLDEDDLDRPIEYARVSGPSERSTLGDMVRHVVNHGTYHRGQVTTMLRQLGADVPPSIDLITYYRDEAER
jgi:uncharacterized damage-inducible protein DinB